MTQDEATTIALQALAWLAGHEDLLGVFMGASGASAEDLAQQATAPEFQGAVLDFLTMDDDWVMRFCQDQSLPYEAPMRARQALPGGAQINWT